jgi:hypothetical protein
MHTSARSDYLHCSRTTSVTSRTAVYGPVRTVVWQGSVGNCRPYADLTASSDKWGKKAVIFGLRSRQDARRRIGLKMLSMPLKMLSMPS